MTTLNIQTLALPTSWHLDTVRDVAGPLRLVKWDLRGDPPVPAEDIDAVVFHHPAGKDGLARLGRLPNLKLVQTQSTGYDGFVDAAGGATVANAYGLHAQPTAELALGLILAAQRALYDFALDQREHRWAPKQTPGLVDKTVLVIGAGGIGQAIGERLRPFGVELIRMGRHGREDDQGTVHGSDALPTLLPKADIVVLITPLTEDTHHLVDAGFLSRMADGALLVNVARGPVVDTGALLAELQSGRLRAALDVVEPEPLPENHPLWDAPNTLITPHVGGRSDALKPRLATFLRDQVGRIARGESLLNIVS